MKFANTPPIHLSNREVLTHFLNVKRDNDDLRQLIPTRKERTETILKKRYPIPDDEDDDPKSRDRRKGKAKKPITSLEDFPELIVSPDQDVKEKVAERRGISEELVWVSDQVISYLCSGLCPTARQTDQGVIDLIDKLQERGLVKSEVLQLVNLAPSEDAELFCVIEDLESRFGHDQEALLADLAQDVSSTLLPQHPPELDIHVETARRIWDPRGAAQATAQSHIMEEDEDEEDMFNQAGDEYVHEAEWGANKEVGVGEEADDPMGLGE